MMNKYKLQPMRYGVYPITLPIFSSVTFGAPMHRKIDLSFRLWIIFSLAHAYFKFEFVWWIVTKQACPY